MWQMLCLMESEVALSFCFDRYYWYVSLQLQISELTIAVGSVISAAAQSSVMFITGRAIAGAGAAGIITGAMRIISLAAPRRQRTLLEAAGATVMGELKDTGKTDGTATDV